MFKVPNKFRVRVGPMGSTDSIGNNGCFIIPSDKKPRMFSIIASDGGGWEHVSVHVEDGDKQRTPLWEEMCQVKDIFWDDDDAVIQIHPPRKYYVNVHPHTLHLWKRSDGWDKVEVFPPLAMV